MAPPKVSIGLPVYNGEKYLRSALDCILRQDFRDFELIISDNASVDATPAICREFAAKDSRIRYLRNETNIGARGNYNRVFELARGEFFKWASHDDKFHPSLIRRCLETFEVSRPEVVLVFSKAEIIDGDGRVLMQSRDTIDERAGRPATRLAWLILYRCWAHPLWGLIRSSALRQTRLMGCTETDHVLLGELAVQGPFVEIPEILYWQRRHAGSAMEIKRTARELLAWNDPGKANVRFLLPHWLRWNAEYCRGIRNARLSHFERLLCYAAVFIIPWGGAPFLNLTAPIRRRLGLTWRRRRPVGDEASVAGAK